VEEKLPSATAEPAVRCSCAERQFLHRKVRMGAMSAAGFGCVITQLHLP
jgi:hypothetical protein